MWRRWLKTKMRLRLSTLILLIIIFGMAVTLVLQQQGEARLRSALRSARNANEEAIRVALDQPFDAKLIPRPTLALLLQEVKRVTRNGEIKRVTRNGVLWDGIPIFVDPIGLQEAGVTMNSPVTVSSKAVPIRKALEDALGQLKLVYTVKDEDGFLLITSKESALPRPYP
jgi:hypothetical protein